ncbi:MAG: 50S ribosomal protein L18 [Xanthomonadales bacterium]|nr:50S ribosomal protein L18 [Gammaproteobacteria bacterium]MBT8052025.1 50S ribosomal protein L18 [Gammaproteobacteria bacterium]MBT8056786.1 50S ribosomal protein L18 [Gammaproteobacteria bacterium]NNJ78167.1 50S ribosomal protein L18 [Xanthomonadales bacterium]NNL04450.1 50S ribosomal protein L18 [Xanthomonadales bacterium]
MEKKKAARLRRARKARAAIRRQGKPRLTIYRSGQHIYAQVINSEDGHVLASASTLQGAVREGLKGTNNKEAAAAVGKAVAERAVEAGVKEVAFDRSGYQYHGRVKVLADAAREVGLKF